MGLSLTASNISKSYNGKVVLTDCSYSFNACGIYILMGPNGSGKSTFLRICALLENPDGGEVKFRGGVGEGVLKNDINLKRRITLVLPKIGIFNATVFNNVAYGLKIRGLSKGEITDRVHSVLDTVGLTHKKSENALTLSSGETQRLGIARAIAIRPEMLFMDEPTASLDPQSTTIIEELIFRIRKQNSMIIVIVTHNIFQAQRLADNVLFMYGGRIVDQGPNKEFFEKPKDERACRFITGQMVY